MFEPSLRCCHPMGACKRWIVADVLLMSALKFGNPIQILIQTKVNDFSHRPWCFRLRGFHDASFLVESMGAIVWQEYRVFTGVNLTRKMTNARRMFSGVSDFTPGRNDG